MKSAASNPPEVLRYLRRALPAQWRRHRKRLKRCQQDFSPRAVHDSRVATRRLLATLELVGAFLAERELKKPRRALKEYLASFSPLRDTQVQLAQVKGWQPKFPVAPEFRAWLRDREARCLREARRAVRQVKTRRMEQRLAQLEKQLRHERKALRPARALALVHAALRLAYARVDLLRQEVNLAEPKTIHRTRIAFKRFRYMVEALAPIFPAVTPGLRQAMRRYQTMMGDIQDVEVLHRTLDKFVEATDPPPDVAPLREELSRRRERLIQRYRQAAHQLERFQPPAVLSKLARAKPQPKS